MQPFTRQQVQLIGATLKARHANRDLAILYLGIDSMLRCGDLLSLRVRDVTDHEGEILERISVRMAKTGEIVKATLTPATRKFLLAMIREESKWADDYLFTGERGPHAQHLSEVSLRAIVKGWAEICHLDPRRYSGHSLRRTKASFVYAQTKNIDAVRRMLGHNSLAYTKEYLGIDDEQVSDLALKCDIFA